MTVNGGTQQRIEVIPAVFPHGSAELHGWARAASEYASSIHVDVMDGIFVPNASWPFTGPGEFDALKSQMAAVMLEAHLMVADPCEIGLTLIDAGFRRIIAHIETIRDVYVADGLLEHWKAGSYTEIGFAIKMETPLEMLDPFVHKADFIQIMTIPHIGMQGVELDPGALERVHTFHRKYPDVVISVDGHIKAENAADFVRAGARRLVVGSAITKSTNPQAAWEKIKNAAESGL